LAGIAGAIDRNPMPDEVLADKDTQLLIRQCLAELNPRYGEVLVAKYVDDLKVSEIAAREGVSEKAIESLLSRSRESFRQVLLAKLTGECPPNAETPQ